MGKTRLMPRQAFTVQQEWLKLDREQTRITAAEVIEQPSDRLGDPTHAVLMDGWFYVSANVGWSKVDDNTGRLKEGASFSPPVLLRFAGRTAAHSGKWPPDRA
jgi:hypothetical protein